MQTIIINQNDANQRIDGFLRKTFPKLSLSLIYRFLRTKHIKINDKKVSHSYRLQLHDKLDVYVKDELLSHKSTLTDFLLAPKNLSIVYEDDNIMIVNKPIGLIVHSDDTNNVDTLINRVQHYLYDKKAWDYLQEHSFAPALVHRIDRNTQGLILVAKNAESLRILNAKLKSREIDKYYWCQVYGIVDPKSGVLKDYLTRNLATKIVKISHKPINDQSQQIITAYHTISHDQKTSLLEIKLITGKTHQIRAHMAFIGHPLVGEKKYTLPQYSKLNEGQYQALTSYKLTFNFTSDAGILNYLNHKTFKI